MGGVPPPLPPRQQNFLKKFLLQNVENKNWEGGGGTPATPHHPTGRQNFREKVKIKFKKNWGGGATSPKPYLPPNHPSRTSSRNGVLVRVLVRVPV